MIELKQISFVRNERYILENISLSIHKNQNWVILGKNGSGKTSLIGIGVFMGLTAWDVQKLKTMYFSVGGGEAGQKMAVLGAFTLYLDFINLFLYMLRFFGDRK